MYSVNLKKLNFCFQYKKSDAKIEVKLGIYKDLGQGLRKALTSTEQSIPEVEKSTISLAKSLQLIKIFGVNIFMKYS